MKLTGSWAPPPAFDAAGWQGPGGGPAGLTRLLSQRTGGNVSTGTGARYVWYTLWGGGLGGNARPTKVPGTGTNN